MEINSTTGLASSAGAVSETTERVLSSDFETFLRMLTVQLENQDPLNPVDSADYAVQLATFSNVEQQVLTNDLLKDLTSQLSSTGLTDKAGWVGMDGRIAGPVMFDGAQVPVFYPSAHPNADQADLVIMDENGIEIDRVQVDLTGGEFTWSGQGPSGQPFPNGLYAFAIESFDEGEFLSAQSAEAFSQIQEVRMSGNAVVAIMEGGVEVPTSLVTALR